MFWGFSTYIHKKYKIEFRRKPAFDERPESYFLDEEIIFEEGEFFPIPNIGDSVRYKYGNRFVSSNVISKRFQYLNGWCVVNIVVTDIFDEEARVID